MQIFFSFGKGALADGGEEFVELVKFFVHVNGGSSELLDFLVRAKEVTEKIGSPTLQRKIERQLARVVLERDDVLEVVEGELGEGRAHIPQY